MMRRQYAEAMLLDTGRALDVLIGMRVLTAASRGMEVSSATCLRHRECHVEGCGLTYDSGFWSKFHVKVHGRRSEELNGESSLGSLKRTGYDTDRPYFTGLILRETWKLSRR
jgi:hypothetical protein